jgi:hypothetical protein
MFGGVMSSVGEKLIDLLVNLEEKVKSLKERVDKLENNKPTNTRDKRLIIDDPLKIRNLDWRKILANAVNAPNELPVDYKFFGEEVTDCNHVDNEAEKKKPDDELLNWPEALFAMMEGRRVIHTEWTDGFYLYEENGIITDSITPVLIPWWQIPMISVTKRQWKVWSGDNE